MLNLLKIDIFWVAKKRKKNLNNSSIFKKMFTTKICKINTTVNLF